VADLEGVMAATPFEGVSLISGARALLEMANPKYAQKEKILRHILALDVEHVILDLGAGSAFNVLDFFLAAHQGILVIVPEPTSIENAYQFLKSSFFRKLKRATPRHRVLATVKKALHDADLETATSPRQLIDRAERIDPDVGRSLRAEADGFSPALVLNRVVTEEHRHLGKQIGDACRDYFGAEMTLLGCVDSDPLVTLSILQRKPAVALFPDSPFARAIDSVTDRLLASTEDPDAG
jgi:flagellar biosynthesis protein FlhG